jgi:myo-inositol-1-phosphate synthase
LRIALIGVGNSASSFLQALNALRAGREIKGLLEIPIKTDEIEVVLAFDIDERKVGKKLKDAIFSEPNVVRKEIEVKEDLIVERGPTLDGTDGILGNIIMESKEKPVEVEERLKEEKVDVCLNLLPTGASRASRYYAECCLISNSSFINATPSEIANAPTLESSYREARVPLLGDDLISQIGGTIFHKGIIDFLESRGVKVLRSYQVDISGTTEALVTLEEWRRDLKKNIKSKLISERRGIEVIAGTSDYVRFLGDRRVSYMVIEGEYSYGAKVRIDISMKTFDGPNAAVPLINLVKISKILKDKGIGGATPEVCSLFFKNPPVKVSIEEASRKLVELLT